MSEPLLAILDDMLGRDYERQDCSLARALEVVGERWTLLIVRDAFFGVRRFNDFQAHLDIPKAVLSERLGWLTENGVLKRQPDPNHAGRHLYELTPQAEISGRRSTRCWCGAAATDRRTAACSSTPRAAPCSTTPAIAPSAM